MTDSEIINELLTLKANAEVISSCCDKLIKKLGPVVLTNKGLTAEELARLRAKGKKTRLKRLQK